MKRLVSLLLASAMLAAVLTGCTGGNDNQGTQAPDNQTPSSQGGDGTADDASLDNGLQVSPAGEMPITSEKVELSIFMRQNSTVSDYEDNKLTKWMEETTNVHVNWNIVPEQDASQKLNLLLAAGVDLPDIIMSDLSTQTIVEQADQGVLIQLDPYIEQYGYYYKKMLEENPLYEPMSKLQDGHVYSLGSVILSEPNAMSNRMWINTTFLQNLNMEKPETPEEFYDYLKAVKEQDANGNGDPSDEVPLTGSAKMWCGLPNTFILNSYVQYDRDNPFYLEDGKVTCAVDKDLYREGLRYMNKLVDDGLLEPNTYTQDGDQVKQIFDGEIAQVGALPAGGVFVVTSMSGDRAKEYEGLAPLKGPGGQYAWYNPYWGLSAPTNAAITNACEHPAVAFKWLDFLYNQETFMRNRFGEPGVDYRIPEEGEIAIDGGPALYEPILEWGSVQNSHWAAAGPQYNPIDNSGVKSDDPYELNQYLWNQTAEFYTPYKRDLDTYFSTNIFFSVEDAQTVADIKATLSDYMKQAEDQFIVGTLDIEKDWDQHLKNLEGMRYQELMDIYQKYLDMQ